MNRPDSAPPRARSRAARQLLIAAGMVCVGLGFAGVFIPLLPTTPFLLLAAACFVRSSDRFYEWLITNRWVGSYLRNYMVYRATTKAVKIVSITTLWCFIVVAAIVAGNWLVRGLLLAVAVGVTIHLSMLRTIAGGAAADAASRGGACRGMTDRRGR